MAVEAGAPGEQGKRYEGLRISFRASHTGGRHPSQATVAIYNVSPDDLAFFRPRRNDVKLLVGYGGVANQLFRGNPVRDGVQYTRLSNGDRVLEVQISDGGAGYSDSHLIRTFSGSTAWNTVVDAVLEVTGWDRGEIEIPEGITLPGSTTFSDKAPDILDRVAQLIPGGGEWFIRDNALFVKGITEPTQERALSISQTNGNLIGSPVATRKGCKVKALIDATIRPGQQVEVDHDLVSGFFRVTDVVFTGDLWGTDWYMDITAKSAGVD